MAAARDRIRQHALHLGFDAVGFAHAQNSQEVVSELRAFLETGCHGEMGWLAANRDRRENPKALWPEARSVVVVGANYAPREDSQDGLLARSTGNISVYARNRDYHDSLKKKLKRLARWICDNLSADAKIFVDTAPVMEKPLAANAGIGWQGKHTNLVSRAFGSWLFLGEVFTNLEISPDTPEVNHCGECRRCLDVCPTQAFMAPYRLDARRCISYLTIEHKGPIGREFREAIGNRIYGCDDCLAVCPWNKFARATTQLDFIERADLAAPALRELAELDETSFRQRFSGSPIKRIGRDRFIRNVLIAIGNSEDASLLDSCIRKLADRSTLVRGAAVWACSRIASAQRLLELARHFEATETDQTVRAEWQWALERVSRP